MQKQLKAPANAPGDRKPPAEVRTKVEEIIEDVRTNGDDAVRRYSALFDKWDRPSYRLSVDEIESIVSSLPQQVLDDIAQVQASVRNFAELQLESLREFEVETMPGVFLGQKNLPIRAVGTYIPGGRYPLLASAHMTTLTAKVAGVERVIACTPPIDGQIPAATVAAMHLAGADEIHIVGGVQAIAAMAVGTESIPKVDLIAGPGNAYVAEAKRQLFGEVGIDLFAGPTEVLIVADETATPATIAVDLVSQAEHGPDSPAILITTDEEIGREAIRLVEAILVDLPTRDFAAPAWADHGQVILVDDLDEAYRLADEFASEHVQIFTREPRRALEAMRDYGALFLGEETCVSYGDKVIGTNHTLPTRGAARYTGGLWVGKFIKTVTYQEIRDLSSSAKLGELCGRAARVERFEGHARSGDLRAARYGGADLPWAAGIFDVSALGNGVRA
ncbi:histidinol dehydrogenase [Streptomyces sp. NPDC057565]|uniref:histidinol dehydrogenase n=1 Tax=Streptomyces sp. NPDC057565 TaxID=3346169 RepID=UPI0036D15DF1